MICWYLFSLVSIKSIPNHNITKSEYSESVDTVLTQNVVCCSVGNHGEIQIVSIKYQECEWWYNKTTLIRLNDYDLLRITRLPRCRI